MPEYLFVYDHNLLDGKEDSNYDPADAILYFYPSSTSVDFQHSLCSPAIGFCQALSNLFQSSPKLFNLDTGAKIACIHEPSDGLISKENNHTITIGLYSDDTLSIHLHEKLAFLYESLIFYTKKCLACTFEKGKRKNGYINNIIVRLMNIINHRDKLSLVFDSSIYCHQDDRSIIIDALIYQSMINIMDSIGRESDSMAVSVLGGCLFHQNSLILNQLSIRTANLFCLLIDCLINDASKTEKETFKSLKRIRIDTDYLQTRNGVFMFQVCVTDDLYRQILEYSKCPVSKTIISCCDNGFHYLYLYLEHHSKMTIMFLIDETDLNVIGKDLLRTFSNLCFNTLGDIEANIATSESTISEKTEIKAVSSVNEWRIKYDETDRSISTSNSSSGNHFAPDWEESLLKRASALHENLVKEKSINKITIKVKTEDLTAERNGDSQTFLMKSFN